MPDKKTDMTLPNVVHKVYECGDDEDMQNAQSIAESCVTAGPALGRIKYDPFALNQATAERAHTDVDTIKPRSRDQYTALFKKAEQRTASATLQMCRVVYEAKKTLNDCEFSDFCTEIGYSDTSSVIRKFCAIGKLQPRLVKHAEFLPVEWSKIYTITQIPARAFDGYVQANFDFRQLKGKDLAGLLQATREEKQIQTLLPRDKDSKQFVFAKVLFTKSYVDAFDWKAVKRALAEVESRLPIRVQFAAEANTAYEWTKANRYNAAKQNAWSVEFSPSNWDYGVDPIKPTTQMDDGTVVAVDTPELTPDS